MSSLYRQTDSFLTELFYGGGGGGGGAHLARPINKALYYSMVIKDTVDSSPFNCGTGCYGRDREDCQHNNFIAN